MASDLGTRRETAHHTMSPRGDIPLLSPNGLAMPVNRNQDAYGGRFAVDPSGSSVLAGYQQATNKLDKDLIRRNIKPYAKYGFEQDLTDLAGMTDQRRYAMATKAVLAKNKVGVKPKKTTSGGGKKNTGGGSKKTSGGTKRATPPKAPPKKPKAPPKKPKAPPKRTTTPASVKKAIAKGKPPVVKVTTPPPLFGRPPVRV